MDNFESKSKDLIREIIFEMRKYFDCELLRVD